MKEPMLKNKKSFLVFRILFGVSILVIGLYYELACAIVSAAMLCWLFVQQKTTSLNFRLNTATLAAFVIFLLYAVSPLWAVDSGLAVWGIVRFLPIPLFVVCLMQLNREEHLALYGDIPYLGALMTAISFALQYIPQLNGIFSVSGRLAGFFEYPNTFACFLLLGIIVLLFAEKQEKVKWRQPVLFGILAVGLLLSGSRAVFLLAVVSIAVSLLLTKKGIVRKVLPLLGGGGVGLLISLLGSGAAVQHIQEMNTGASTFLGRLLYWKDALPVILRHPFGLGYLGYYFTQGSFQTGVYSVRFVHNDFLQLMLDIGWIPAILAVMAIIQSLWSKRVTVMQKVFLLTLLAHCCFDFDLSFIAIYFLVFLSLDLEEGKTKKLKVSKLAIPAAVIVSCVALYIGAASVFSYAGNAAAAVRLYPWDTFSNMALLTATDDTGALRALSDKILKQNESVALAWDAKANAAYADGDFGEVIACKQNAIALNKYAAEEYEDYFNKLRIGRELYLQSGDQASAEICKAELLAIPDRMEQVVADTSSIAWKIADVPELVLSDESMAYIQSLLGT